MEWVRSFQLDLTSQVIAIDGKTSRRSFDGESRALHVISAFASEVGVVLGQLQVDGKSNEITAIPQLLEVLDLVGATVTLDAMGCQSTVVDKILERGANYVIGLKGNQGRLNDDVRLLFEDKPAAMTFAVREEFDKGHGRIETRKCTVTDDIQWLKDRHPHWGLPLKLKGSVTSKARYRWRSVTTSAALRPIPKQHLTPSVSIGALKTNCIGCWMSALVMIKAASGKAMPTRTSR